MISVLKWIYFKMTLSEWLLLLYTSSNKGYILYTWLNRQAKLTLISFKWLIIYWWSIFNAFFLQDTRLQKSRKHKVVLVDKELKYLVFVTKVNNFLIKRTMVIIHIHALTSIRPIRKSYLESFSIRKCWRKLFVHPGSLLLRYTHLYQPCYNWLMVT